MKITFKNVDQGDSIILEWEDDGQKKIGIIDCNLNRRKENPVLEYLKKQDYTNILFLILSHPHTDHYSGFPQLLTYLLENNISLDYFIHTSTAVPDFLKMANESREAVNLLQELIRNIQKCEKKYNTVFGTVTAGLNDEFALGGGYIIKFLAPGSRHLQNYTARVDYDHDYEVDGNSHFANWLSTVLQLKKDDDYVLFTADAPKEVLKDLGISDRKSKKLFDGKKLVLCQSPHHGASKNHSNSFWKLRTKAENTPVVFSVGKNHYGHPSEDAVKFFFENDFKVYSTNKVCGLQTLSLKGEAKVGEMFADIFSTDNTIDFNTDFFGDKAFMLDNGNIRAL